MTPTKKTARTIKRTLADVSAVAVRRLELPPNLQGSFVCDPDRLTIPERIELEDGRLRYWWWKGKRESSHAITERLLEEFLALSAGEDEAVLAFAHRWGVLQLCESHGWSESHASCRDREEGGPLAELDADGAQSERLSDWYAWALYLRDIFNAIAALKAGRCPAPWGAWFRRERRPQRGLVSPLARALDRYEEARRKDSPRAFDAQFEWRSVAHTLNSVLGTIRVAPILVLSQSGRPHIKLGSTITERGTPLLAAIVIQLLLFAVSGHRHILTCAYCGTVFSREGRRPNPNRATYCEDCRKAGAPNVIARRRWREKQKDRSRGNVPARKPRRHGEKTRKG